MDVIGRMKERKATVLDILLNLKFSLESWKYVGNRWPGIFLRWLKEWFQVLAGNHMGIQIGPVWQARVGKLFLFVVFFLMEEQKRLGFWMDGIRRRDRIGWVLCLHAFAESFQIFF